MMALDEYDAPPFDQRTNDETPVVQTGRIIGIRMMAMMNMAILTIGQSAKQNYRGLSRLRLMMWKPTIHQWVRILCVRNI